MLSCWGGLQDLQLFAAGGGCRCFGQAAVGMQMFGQYGDEAGGCGIRRGSWELLLLLAA